MEKPEIDMAEFEKYKQQTPIVKVFPIRNPKDTDMEDTVLTDAKDHITTGIEKSLTPGPDANLEVTGGEVTAAGGVQVREGEDGHAVRALVALRDGAGVLVRRDQAGEVASVHVLLEVRSASL